MERTLALIKPDATQRYLEGEIITMIQGADLRIIGMKMLSLRDTQAQEFYCEHKDKDFFEDLVTFMCSAPIVALVLEGKDAVKCYRELIGATDPAFAKEGTVRKLFAKSLRANSVHGSDSIGSAQREICFFFSTSEIL